MKALFVMILLAVGISSFSQSAKDARLNRLKSKTTMKTVENNGVPTIFKETYEEFDKNGKTTLKTEYSKSGSVKHQETYKYDSFVNVTEYVESDTKDGTVFKTVFTYNANGDKVSETITDVSCKLVEKSTYTYDSKGLRTEKREYNSDGSLKSIRKISYEYY